MNLFSVVVAVLAAVAIIVIGIMYVVVPIRMSRSFGLPPPGDDPNVAWWLRLKGTRDIVSGIVLFALLAWGAPHILGSIMLIQAITPFGDMTTVLSSRGSTKTALGVHGLTAATMIVGAIPLLLGRA